MTVTDAIHFFGVEAVRDPYPLHDRVRAEATDVGAWPSSILVRRLERLELACE
ncbi:hypothetical protein [Mycobacterium sp.]|jgi:hypothetical protein|uniref:hypothetical protein n=1 Tax=Mycobacterium sp. TaxID=1785 RepID=UPI003F7FF145